MNHMNQIKHLIEFNFRLHISIEWGHSRLPFGVASLPIQLSTRAEMSQRLISSFRTETAVEYSPASTSNAKRPAFAFTLDDMGKRDLGREILYRLPRRAILENTYRYLQVSVSSIS